ncbi:P1 family peptidase [Halovulum dunhuangense]|uniref:P1 family peptidase n=1 Tax=Halovulum dunhuangense TaxID=1505036 RepID=A0A849L059_9RHOB|nr:P1 family peptidase [Halovulum dunhuangense]NNU79270.1 P1 family peptidase [Halovulum dunhuangense]
MRPGPLNLITDVAGLRVGNASDARVKTGVTVLTADAPFTAGVDIRGGAPGTRETDLLAPDKTVAAVDALVLSGGSAYGLDAASGVMEGLAAMGRGFAVGPARVPIVPAAILFDLLNGGDKDWPENPYRALGRAALEAAGTNFALGTQGAGTGALTARLKGGLGSASAVLPSGAVVGALVAANPVGCASMPDSRHFWAWPWEEDAEFGGLGAPSHRPRSLGLRDTKLARDRSATTIAIVATDATLDKAGCARLAVAAHDGLARAIAPSHTQMDGDLVFALSTGARPMPDPTETLLLGHAAAITLARAVARAIHGATPAPGDVLPAWCEL